LAVTTVTQVPANYKKQITPGIRFKASVEGSTPIPLNEGS